VRDRAKLAARVQELVRRAQQTRRPSTLTGVLLATIALGGRLGEEATAALLGLVGPALDAAGPPDPSQLTDQTKLLGSALFFAAHYGRSDLVAVFVDRLLKLLETRSARALLEPVGTLVEQTLRSLRRLGLRDETQALMRQIEAALLGGQSLAQVRAREGRSWPDMLRVLVHLAGCWMDYGGVDHAQPALDEARRVLLRDRKGSPAERPNARQYPLLASAYVSALGAAPPQLAQERIEELFAPGRMDPLSTAQTWHHYYALFHLNVAEAVVQALVTEDLTLGPAARRWLDDDEYLIRRRINRDLEAALGGMLKDK
jgi:cellulose synthase operon protein C